MSIQSISATGPLRLWHIDLDGPQPPARRTCLSSDERARSLRFVFERDRDRFVAARGALRNLLSEVVARPPEALHFSYGPFGKPFLSGERGSTHFNLSHSGADALIAVSDQHAVGVDVERLRVVPDAMALASSCLTTAECDMLRQTPLAARSLAFLTCWTRKEACLKTVGSGLHTDPRTIEVGVDPDRQAVRLATADGAMELRVHSFTHLDRLVCAVAHVTGVHSFGFERPSAERELT